MKDNLVMDKAYAFALRAVKLYKYLIANQKEFILSKQLLRSGAAIGALLREAEHAQSTADFINKVNVALKEANETEYWIMLLKDSEYITPECYNSIHEDCVDLIKLLTSILKTTKQNALKQN